MTEYSYRSAPVAQDLSWHANTATVGSNPSIPIEYRFMPPARWDIEEEEEDPIQSRMCYWEMRFEPFIPIITPTGNAVIELVEEPRFNADEVIAFIEGGDGA